MSNKKNSDNKLPGAREEELHRETFENENNASTAIHRGKRSAFNEDGDLSTNPPGRKRDFSDGEIEEGDEDYDDEEELVESDFDIDEDDDDDDDEEDDEEKSV